MYYVEYNLEKVFVLDQKYFHLNETKKKTQNHILEKISLTR